MSAPPPSLSPARRRPRWRLLGRIAVLIFAVAAVGFGVVVAWTRSDAFERWARRQLIVKIEQTIGGRAEVAAFHWRPLQLETEADGISIHGLESGTDAPFASVDRVRARLSILDFWSPRVLLRDLEILRPRVHLIVYPDGSTNQPHPGKLASSKEQPIDSLLDLKAGQVAVEAGTLDFEDRASGFDFQDRLIPLDFAASDVALNMRYVPAAKGAAEHYRVEAGARNLSIVRGRPPGKQPSAQGYVQATFDLERNALRIESLRITSLGRPALGRPAKDAASPKGAAKEHSLELSGALEDFSHPHWQGRILGELDMTLLDPVTGYPRSPEGVARLDLAGAGQGGEFRIDGGVHIENGSYVDPGIVNATGLGLDAHVHADPNQLLISQIVARLKPGGRIEGTVALQHWLPSIAGAPVIESRDSSRSQHSRQSDVTVPVNGKVTAELKDVSLDTVLDIVGQPPLQRLGLDTRLTGPAKAAWNDGETSTLSVSAMLALAAPARSEPGEVGAAGAVDATYTHRNGAVDLRRFELHTPNSELDAHGTLGAYPSTSPSDMTVGFHSLNIADFDTFLRNLGLERRGKAGVAALPAALSGGIDYHGSWTGSLVDPHLAGAVQATGLSVEFLPRPGDSSGQPQWLRFDAAQANGSYSAQRIAIDHGFLSQGEASILFDGSLASSAPPAAERRAQPPEFDSDSLLHVRVHATHVAVDQLLPFTGRDLPLKGVFDTQFELTGPVRDLSGSGSAELSGGSAFGQPIDRVRAQATLSGQTLRLSSIAVNLASGEIAGSGQLNLTSRQFLLDSRGSAIDLARIAILTQHGVDAAGALGFNVTGSGSLDDPRLDAHAQFANLAVDGEPLGPLTVTARAAARSVHYQAATHLEGAALTIDGQTALAQGYNTSARMGFSGFNVDALLRMAHIEAITGQSALKGTVTVEGPLARPDDLHGEARLDEFAVALSGVHLKSEGGLHASLANARIALDPLHITGEETDLHLAGSLSLKDRRQLDFAASGAVNLKLGQMLDPDLTASGATTFQVEAHGPLQNPGLRGRVDFQNGSLALGDVPNGLSQIHGTLEFNQDRLEVRSLTAMSGGGQLGVTGYLAWQRGLYADLRVSGKGIRIRYPAGVSSLADAELHLQGLENNLLLGGSVLITRLSVSPDLDIAALAAQANSVQAIVPPDAPSNHIRLDVRITSSPQLNFQNSVAKLAGDVDLRLRGTVATPSLLGSVQITEGSALIAGTRYELERGAVSFTNPVRIEPLIDLSASAHVSDYDITLGLHGTPAKMSVTYRSDPPLPEADVVALLALGRTTDQQRLYTQQQEQEASNPATDALLGGALNATVSSRVQKLFGAGSVKIDPNYVGVLGNSTSRIIVEEQVGRDLTLTYATNVDTTQQQLLQAEIAINRHVSVLVARDESGVFSMVVKATRRYR